jgi:SAM-dependent methyltransferase
MMVESAPRGAAKAKAVKQNYNADPPKKKTIVEHSKTQMEAKEVTDGKDYKLMVEQTVVGTMNGSVFPIGPVEYWNKRFAKDTNPYEWLSRYGGISDIIEDHITHDQRILITGCGNSRLAQDLFEHGYKHISNTDFSDVVIEQMKAKYANFPPKMSQNVTWDVMDCNELLESSFPDKFDVCIDKAVLDTMLCAEGEAICRFSARYHSPAISFPSNAKRPSFNRSPVAFFSLMPSLSLLLSLSQGFKKNIPRYMKGLAHVLKPSGKLLLLSHGVPEKRKKWITGSWQQTSYGFVDEIAVVEVPKCLMQVRVVCPHAPQC